jgi:uncharacterized protein YukE
MNEIDEYQQIYQQCQRFNHSLTRIMAALDRMRT